MPARRMLVVAQALAAVLSGAPALAAPELQATPDAVQCVVYLDAVGARQSEVVSRPFHTLMPVSVDAPDDLGAIGARPGELQRAFVAHVREAFPNRALSGQPFCTLADNVSVLAVQAQDNNQRVGRTGNGFFVDIVQTDWPASAYYPAPPPVVATQAPVTRHAKTSVHHKHCPTAKAVHAGARVPKGCPKH